MRSREAIEDQISRYKALLWITSDPMTRDALFLSIRALQEDVERIDRGETVDGPRIEGERRAAADRA